MTSRQVRNRRLAEQIFAFQTKPEKKFSEKKFSKSDGNGDGGSEEAEVICLPHINVGLQDWPFSTSHSSK